MNRKSNARGFTLTEMLVVIAIIVVITLIAIPAIRTLTGTKSIDAAQNAMSALIVRAREEAVGIQDVRGVMFYLDPTEDVVKGVIVQSVRAEGPSDTASVYLDMVADREFVNLPRGVGIQLVNNNGGGGSTDRYIGFNPVAGTITPATNVRYGGVILFDGFGRLISQSYGLKLKLYGATGPTNLAQFVFGMTGTVSGDLTPGTVSQFGFVLFDREAFGNIGGTDGDPNIDPAIITYGATGSSPPSEADEEAWLDTNSTPILINRYNGTLIRGE